MLEMTTDGARGVLGAPAAGAATAAPAAGSPGGEAGAKAKAEPAKDRGALSSDFETFLKMLTAQLRHQDPLNPIESTDFAVQLATFSGVEQQVRTNELLAELAGGGGAGGASHAAWIGLEALTPAPARFEGVPLALEVSPPEGMAEGAMAALVVTDEAGIEVGRYPVDPAQGRITWAGTDGMGEPLPEGRYAFTLRAVGADGAEEAHPVLSYARVTEVRPGPEGTRVVLDGGGEVAAEEVAALRAPA